MVDPNLMPEQQPQRRMAPNPLLEALKREVNETGGRLTVVEERVGNLRKKTQLTEQTLIDYEREARADLKALSQRVLELARTVEDVKEKIDAMSGEISGVVKKHEFTVLERYMDLWQPLQFVTREEAKMLLKGRVPRKP